jgi:hypothetical protein
MFKCIGNMERFNNILMDLTIVFLIFNLLKIVMPKVSKLYHFKLHDVGSFGNLKVIRLSHYN